jgi:putative ABC transport system substrate-binding protein
LKSNKGRKNQKVYKYEFMKRSLLVLLIFILAIASGWYFLSNRDAGLREQKVYRVGILSGLDFFIVIADGLKEKMTELGYIEGENIIYDIQRTNFEPEKERQILEKFVEDDVDLIFTFPTEVSLAAKEVTEGTAIPVVFASAFVEGNDLIDNVQQPGNHITGVRYPGVDIAVKRLEILHEIMPDAKRIWLPYNKDYPAVPPELELVRPAAESLGITLIEFPATGLEDVRGDLEKRRESDNFDFDAVLYIPESLSTTAAVFDVIASYTRVRKIPVMGTKILTEDYGTVFGITTNNPEFGVLAAPLVNKIFEGTPAGTIPVVSAESRIKINYKVAQELGLTIPEGLLTSADEIIR